ncbi:MAG: IclR family transcriptional regulator [Candidatus Promineifilaceae bacterium]|nr:IclR family transcriptional regulator [Candidatus Promineifilaceae bacterium]
MPDYTIAVLEDAFDILTALLAAADGRALSECARETGISKNKTFRILATLEKQRLVQRDEEGIYRLGIRFLAFGERVRRQTDLLRAAQGAIDWLAEETGESIFLGVVDGQEALCVAARESHRSVRLFAHIGRRAPLYVGGVPKVLLAFQPEEDRAELLDQIELKPFTADTVIERAALEELLANVRAQGYIISADDLDLGAHSVAAPIFDYTGRIVAAISIAGPSVRFTEAALRRYVKLVREAAADISSALGYEEVQGLASDGDRRRKSALVL